MSLPLFPLFSLSFPLHFIFCLYIYILLKIIYFQQWTWALKKFLSTLFLRIISNLKMSQKYTHHVRTFIYSLPSFVIANIPLCVPFFIWALSLHLKQQKFTASRFWKLEVWDHGVSWVLFALKGEKRVPTRSLCFWLIFVFSQHNSSLHM